VLVGDFPAIGEYAPLVVGGNSEFSGSGLPRGSSSHEVHYWGVSIIEPAVTELAQELQISEGFFSELAKAAAERGMLLSAYRGAGEWIDMGRRESVRENILRAGNFIHPSACLSSDVSLKGRWHIGQGCILGGGTHLSDSVMLQGSTLESGSLVDGLLPWFCSSRDGAML
jgi:NDP-sugar pyrophosphorylase family protein